MVLKRNNNKRLSGGRPLKKEFMQMEGVIADMCLNEAGSIVVDADTHSVFPSQCGGCVERMREIEAKYDPTNVFHYALLSKK